jgi:hypothetical protein
MRFCCFAPARLTTGWGLRGTESAITVAEEKEDIVRRKAKRWIGRQLGIQRLDDAVSYLLAREGNVLSSAEPGTTGNAVLRDAFYHLFAVLQPKVFCDVGANDGATSCSGCRT